MFGLTRLPTYLVICDARPDGQVIVQKVRAENAAAANMRVTLASERYAREIHLRDPDLRILTSECWRCPD